MKNRIKPRTVIIAATACVVLLGIVLLYFSSVRSRHFAELKASYAYCGDNNILIKFPSELVFQPNELLAYNPENRRTSAVEYTTLNLTLPARDIYTA